jgi:hypothetical protein
VRQEQRRRLVMERRHGIRNSFRFLPADIPWNLISPDKKPNSARESVNPRYLLSG